MKVLIQRVLEANVAINKKIYNSIDKGLVLFVGFCYNDTIKEIEYLVDKIINLRIFDDEKGVMNKSIQEVGGSILSISQFTLYADTQNGRRPSYKNSMNSEEAREFYDIFNQKLRETDLSIKTGIFQSDMKVTLINDGPVTIMLEKEGKK